MTASIGGGHATSVSPPEFRKFSMHPIVTDTAPAAIGPYSQAIVANGFLFVSGQLPIDPATGAFAATTAAGQMRQCLANISAVAEAAGASLSDVVKTSVFVADLAEFAQINAVYGEFFRAPFPARSTFEVSSLPKGALVEVEAIVALNTES